MFAIIRTGGKQYRVAPGDVIRVEKLAGEAGDIVAIGDVLMLGGDEPQAGGPTIDGASVAAEVLNQGRGEKIIVFKKKRRKGYRRTRGHRQLLTELRITEILTDGKQPSAKAAEAKPAKKLDADENSAEADEKKTKAKAKSAETKSAAKKADKPAKAKDKGSSKDKDKAKADKPKADKKPAKAKKDD